MTAARKEAGVVQANDSTEHVTPRAPLEPRNLKFELGPDVPPYWHGGRKAVTHFFNNLSVFLPVG